ncbi:sensor histidine kinase [Natronosporangium hydrolyticum]|uniref:Oxygen sensor histidine kinase NreB n=1 Tax=Natronosporangium hydrolyticum TaxID=2811111 RepID=A0A895YII8_9ACTN|nr:sensor histidine kinase [Natronosporangium hydrolyticum]QSB13940.1 sensor histidine kinase [Natronosporangium hydrolyticum]
MTSDATPVPTKDPHPWGRRYEQMVTLLPWALLAVATLVSQLSPQHWPERAVTLGLVLVAAVWLYLGHTRAAPEQRRGSGAIAVVFLGLLVFFVALMSRDQAFVIFTVAGFFVAGELGRWPRAVAGVFATSVIMHTMLGLLSADPADVITFVMAVLVQTVAIGAGYFFSEKVSEHDRRREETMVRLASTLEENAGLHAQLVHQAREAGVLDERQRMAREIHDTLAQGLAGIITQTQAAQRVWHRPEQARPYLDRALDLAKESLAEARRSVAALSPPSLDGAQLPEALGDLTRRWAVDTDIPVDYEVTGDSLPLSPVVEVTLFRVAQEALTNVAKHAHAGHVGVTLSYLGDTVLLDVRDDGSGMDDPSRAGFGLNSMRQRVRGVGGTLAVESTPAAGTAICASVPAVPAAAAPSLEPPVPPVLAP